MTLKEDKTEGLDWKLTMVASGLAGFTIPHYISCNSNRQNVHYAIVQFVRQEIHVLDSVRAPHCAQINIGTN